MAFPYSSTDSEEMLELQRRRLDPTDDQYMFSTAAFKYHEDHTLKDLLEKIFTPPESRLSISEVKEHPFFVNGYMKMFAKTGLIH